MLKISKSLRPIVSTLFQLALAYASEYIVHVIGVVFIFSLNDFAGETIIVSEPLPCVTSAEQSQRHAVNISK